jgi:Holliday junction resolvase-like predicted endonuclease
VPLAAWRVGDQQPARITRSSVALERSLEDWIEADPSLVFDGLVIVGRQVGVAGGRLDLLGLDPSGRWMVVEIKAGRLYRDVIAQALDYVASVRRLPAERLRSVAVEYLAAHPNPDASERLGGALTGEDDTSPPEVAALVVGTARDPGLERLIDFLTTDHGIAIEAVTFEVFEPGDGSMILVREIAEISREPVIEPVPEDQRLEAVLAHAEAVGHRGLFEDLLAAGTRVGLSPRPYKHSMMFSPPTNRTRMLFTIFSEERGSRIYTSADAFEEFFPKISAVEARRHLGADGYRELNQTTAREFIAGLERLLDETATQGASRV